MKKKLINSLPFKRRVTGRTNYKKRIALLKSEHPRLVIRKSLKNIHMALAEYGEKGDKILLSVNSRSLDKLGWKADKGNVPSAYLTGFLLGKKAKHSGIESAVLDMGLSSSVKGSRIYAAVAGALDAGMKIPQNPEILPAKDRLNGTHIAKYAEALKNDKIKYEKQFGLYLKKNIDPSHLPKHFEEVKNKIIKA